MLLNCDKFFIEELQKEGYDIDYKKVVAIYKQSRQSDGFKRRQARKQREEVEMMKAGDAILELIEKENEAKTNKRRTKKSGG